MVARIKNKFIKPENKVKLIRFGLLSGVTFNINLSYQAQLYFGLWERETLEFVRLFSRDIATAIDIGAGEGEYALYFIQKTLASTIIICEPSDSSRSMLEKNIKLNNPLRECKLNFIKDFINNSNVEGNRTLDSMLDIISFPCLIKIDTDGKELDILKGANSLLANPGSRFIIETHSRELEDNCISLLQSYGFTTKIIRNAWWRLFIPEQRPIPHNRWLVAIKQLTI